MNGRQIYDQLNQVNFIGILAETFNVFVPTQESFDAGEDTEKLFKAFNPESEVENQSPESLQEFYD
jgi:hypothetical protein